MSDFCLGSVWGVEQAELAELTAAVSKMNQAQMTVTVTSGGEEDDDLLSSRSDLLAAMLERCSDMYLTIFTRICSFSTGFLLGNSARSRCRPLGGASPPRILQSQH